MAPDFRDERVVVGGAGLEPTIATDHLLHDRADPRQARLERGKIRSKNGWEVQG
jgi:hypothetical protein